MSYASPKMVIIFLAQVVWFAGYPCLQSHATMVLAITTDKAAYIGADGRADPQGNICKLVVGKRMAVGTSGHLEDKATGFSARATITTALVSSHDFASGIESVIIALEPPLERSLAWGFQRSTAEYMAKYQGRVALALLFIGIDQQGPKIAHVAWRTENGRIFRLPQRTLGPNEFDAIGSFDAFMEYVARTPEWKRQHPAARIVKALQIQSGAHPQTVGRPFAIVRITRGRGVEWIKGGACSTHGEHGQHHQPATRNLAHYPRAPHCKLPASLC